MDGFDGWREISERGVSNVELTFGLALSIFLAGGFVLVFTYFKIRQFDRQYYPKNRNEKG